MIMEDVEKNKWRYIRVYSLDEVYFLLIDLVR